MAEFWVTDKQLQAELDWGSFVQIPPGEMIEVAYWGESGTVRICWAVTKSDDNFGGLSVTETDLRSHAHRIQRQDAACEHP